MGDAFARSVTVQEGATLAVNADGRLYIGQSAASGAAAHQLIVEGEVAIAGSSSATTFEQALSAEVTVTGSTQVVGHGLLGVGALGFFQGGPVVVSTTAPADGSLAGPSLAGVQRGDPTIEGDADVVDVSYLRPGASSDLGIQLVFSREGDVVTELVQLAFPDVDVDLTYDVLERLRGTPTA